MTILEHRRSLTMLIAVACWATRLPAAEPPRFQFARTIETAPRQQEELVAVPFDSEIYDATMDTLQDLRITGPAGVTIPFILRTQVQTRSRTTRHFERAEQVSLKPIPEGGLELRFRVDPDRQGPPPDGFTVVTPLKDFEQRVRVFRVDEPDELASEAIIFDYSRYMDVRETVVRLPAPGPREFRVIVDAPTSEQVSQLKELTRTFRGGKEESVEERRTVADRPFRIDRIDLWWETTSEEIEKDVLAEYAIDNIRVSEDAERKETVIEFDTHREPLSVLKIETPARNFSRTATVEAQVAIGGRSEWRTIGSATLARFSFQAVSREELEIPIQSNRAKTCRIRIENRDSAPLEITKIHARGSVHEVVFIAEPSGTYQLHYAAEVTRAPEYDVVSVRAALAAGSSPVAGRLGPIAPSTMAVLAPRSISGAFLNDPLILGTVIVLLVALLGFGLFHASQRVSDLPPQDE